MLRVDGYTLWDRIHHTRHSEVYTGVRDADGMRVVVKRYRSKRGAGSHRAERELQILTRIDSDRIVRPIELASAGEERVLVVERVSGYPLSRFAKGRGLSLDDFLAIALGLTRALADVHDARVIHKDIKLSNVLVEPEAMKVSLIDFGIATEFGRAEETAPPQTAEGTLRYIAPEQTGRMGLGVDFRTDLYSLGASFYELLTGEPPFAATRANDLVCAHMAQRPTPAAEVERSVPVALSRIVEKLLEKDPERRYQTARGLAADLERCAKQFELGGEIDEDLVLGSADVSDRLRFPSKLYGRERETAALMQSLERLRGRGSSEWLFLAGPAGIGKSSLPGTLREPLVRAGGFLAEAKFDADRRERPYAGVAVVLEALTAQMLAGNAGRVGEWGERIRAGVGAIGGVLVDLAPSLRHLVDDFPAAPAVGAVEERERLGLAFRRFVGSIAGPGHPLVLFFDDLQWADAGTLKLLGMLAAEQRPSGLLVIGGYRDNEVDAEHPAMRFIDRVAGSGAHVETHRLEPLALEHTNALLSDALGRSPDETRGLARRVGLKSQHNPLLIRRLMFHLWDRDLIWHDHGVGWTWDERKLTEADITDDAAAMVAARIDALSERGQRLIKTASLIGTVFELEMVVALGSLDRLDALHELMALVEQGLVAPCREGFKFVHDRIRESAQSRLVEGERAKLHHQAARILLEQTPPEEIHALAFQLSDHLIGATELLDERERQRAVEILGLAGTMSLAKGAPDSAAHYLGVVRALLREADWDGLRALAFGAYLRSAEAEIQLQHFAAAEELLAALEERELDPLEYARIVATRVSAASMRVDDRAVELALAGLRRFGIHWPRHPSRLRVRFELWRTAHVLRVRGDEAMFRPADRPDPAWIGPLLILRAAATRLTVASVRLAGLATCHSLRIASSRGFVESPGYALVGFANLWIVIERDFARARRYARAAASFSEEAQGSVSAARCRLIETFLIEPWLQSRRGVVTRLDAAAETARELGDLEYVNLALHNRDALAALSGVPLSRVAKLVDADDAQPARRIIRHVYGLLRETSVDWSVEEPRIAAYLDSPEGEVLYASDHIVAALCFAGRFGLAWQLSERIWLRVLDTGGLGSRVADHTFYRGLASGALAARARGRTRRLYMRALRTCLRRLRAWAREGPDFVHMAGLLEAERLRVRRRSLAAGKLYRKAADRALDAGYVQHAALCYEREARLLIDSRRSAAARAALETASRLYAEWGARLKSAELDELIASEDTR